MTHRRCCWCGVFVANDTRLTAWRVRVSWTGGPPDNRQNPRSQWNYWARLLCPSCSRAATSGGWKRVTVAEVERRRTRGWRDISRRWAA